MSSEQRIEMPKAEDLTHAVGVVVPLPNELWYVSEREQQAYWESLHGEFSTLARDCLDRQFQYDLTREHYQIGPTAEWSYTDLFSLYEDFRPLLDDSLRVLALAKLAKSFSRRIAQRTPRKPIFTGSWIVSLCCADVRKRHPSAKWSVQAYARELQPYNSVAHPGGKEQYVVWIRIARCQYCYVVTGEADVVEHFMIKKRRVLPLTFPDILGLETSDEMLRTPHVVLE